MITDHWVGSHPSLIPCDLSPTNEIKLWFHDFINSSSFKFSLAPRAPIDADWFKRRNGYLRRHVLPFERVRLRERFLLSGLLTSWYFLYNETPPDSSWVWTWYPDGAQWRDSVEEYGERAVSRVLELHK